MKNKSKNKRVKILLLSVLTLFSILIISNFVSALTHITNCTQLQDINNNLSENYVLDNNIDCSDTINWNGGEGFSPIGQFFPSNPFLADFNGQGFNISNLYMNNLNSNSWGGLFGFVKGGTIEHINLINANITCDKANGLVSSCLDCFINDSSVSGNLQGTGFSPQGALVGLIRNTTIINCHADTNITSLTGYDVGGLVGFMFYNSIADPNSNNIMNSYSTGNIITAGDSGGLVGFIEGDGSSDILQNITNSYAIENIICSDVHCGGLVGYTGYTGDTFFIINSFAVSNITGTDYVGGLIGSISSLSIAPNITNSFSTGNITGNSYVGGLIGSIEDSDLTITNSYSTVFVTGLVSDSGGLTGFGTANCTNSYWNQNLSGQTTSSCGTELTDSEMLLQSSYSNWDFVNIWDIPSSIPCLRFNCIFPALEIVVIPSSVSGNAIYQVMNSSGAGLGLFIQFLGQALPLLLIGLGLVAILVAIGYSIFQIVMISLGRKK